MLHNPQRRGFLTRVAGAMTIVGLGATVGSFVLSMNPAADVGAARDRLDVDISGVVPGEPLLLPWRGVPVLILRRDEEQKAALRDPVLQAELRDPDSRRRQQPDYARNWHRSIREDLGVYIGKCTRLGCVLRDPLWCPCCGARFDLAGRVVSGPAPVNLAVPPHRFIDDMTLRLGQNPDMFPYDLDMIERA